MPSKSSPNSASGRWTWVVTLNDGSLYYPIGQSGQSKQSNWIDSVTFGDNLKGWRELLRNGESATTSMTGRLSRVRIQSGLISYAQNFGIERKALLGGAIGTFSVAPPGNPDVLSETDANSQALGTFAQKIVNARSAVQGGVVVGELMQTLRMIRHPAQGLRRLITDWHTEAQLIRAGHKVGSLASRMRRVAQNLGDAWLEHAFGWKPLLSDIDGACKALAESHVGSSLLTRRITAHAEVRVSASIPGDSINGSGIALWRESERTIGTTMVIYRGAVRLEARDPVTMDPALFGFTPEQFLPTAWELLPWSFLIDYFTNIGDIIYGWSSLMCNLKWCNRTIRKTYERTYTADCSKAVTAAFQSCVPAVVIGTNTYVSRAKYTGTTVPDFDFRMPGMGSKRWLNIAALIASRGSDRSWHFD